MNSTAADKHLHEMAFVSTLSHLHEEIDAAVAAAYGWPVNLPDSEILERLVALNTVRADEENQGKIRWLRPDLQSPPQKDLALENKLTRPRRSPDRSAQPRSRAKPAWPKDRPSQVEAVSKALISTGQPMTSREIAALFSRGKPAEVSEILTALVTLGRAHKAERRGAFTL